MQLTLARGTLVLLLVATLVGASWPAKQAANRRLIAGSVSQQKNIRAIPSSRSLVLRATHILLIQIVSSQASAWMTDQAASPKRTVRLTVRLEEILKGAVQQPPGSEMSIQVDQIGRPGKRYYAVPGVWSDEPIDPGTRLVAFSSSPSDQAGVLLVEPSCIKVLLADKYLLDVKLAMQAETDKLTLPGLLKLAQPSAGSLDYVFAEYVVAKFDDSLLQDIDAFRLLMKFIENPTLSTVARSTLLTSVYHKLIAFDPAPMPYVQALTVTMFHLVALPQASALHDNILQVYLPNLLGLSGGGPPRKKAGDVFRGIPEERQKAERALQAYRGKVPADALMRWLRG